MNIINIVNRMLYPNKYSSDAYINYIKKLGGGVGKNCYIFEPKSVNIDMFRPYLFKMGDNVVICAKTTILTHDYSHTVLHEKYGINIGDAKPVTIGNNVFIGIGAMILMGSKIGDNVIIGANAVVHGEIPDDSVVAGNPAKVIFTLEEYYRKRLENEKACALENVRLSKERLGRVPTIEEMGDAFAWLYLKRDKKNIQKYSSFFSLPGKNNDKLKENFMNTKPKYNSYEEFIKEAELY